MTTYYFAYGSNMDADQMRERCPDSKLVGPAKLPGYRLSFTIYSPLRQCGCADIVPSEQDAVYGLLYEVSASDLAALDGFEGHPVHYQRIIVSPETSGEKVIAYSYEVVTKEPGHQPSPHYIGLLRTAAAQHSFPAHYQTLLTQTSFD